MFTGVVKLRQMQHREASLYCTRESVGKRSIQGG